MSGSLWITFVATKAVIGITPGPAVMLVMSHGLTRGGRSQWAAMGIVLVNAMFFVLAAMGLGAVLTVSSETFVVLKWIASIYMIVAGVRGILRSSRTAAVEEGPAQSGWRACWMGALMQMANPNALLFFAAILPQFINPRGRYVPQVCLLGVTGLVLDCVVLTLYGVFASQWAGFASTPRVRVLTNRLAGFLLIATGVLTAIMR